jgi:hypothetical protein
MKMAKLMPFLLCSSILVAQSSSSRTDIIKTYSQNEIFYLISIPFDDEFPTLRGRTSVYQEGSQDPLYVFDRGFDTVERDNNNLILSNNGEIIFYAIPWDANENQEGLKSITIYSKGKLLRSYTQDQITGCDSAIERCSLVYSNYDLVVDKAKSKYGTVDYRKVLKEGVDEREKFLSDFPIFCNNDTVYITDSRKRVHRFDLKEGKYIGFDVFESVYEQIKNIGRFNRVELTGYESPVFLKFPNLANGEDPYKSLAKTIGMKSASISESKDQQYRQYSFKIRASVFQDGRLDIEGIDFDNELPEGRIRKFFEENRFDASSIPKIFEKWYLGDEYFFLRKRSEKLARKEKKDEIEKNEIEAQKRLTLEFINGVYIPRNLGECFVELDKLLKVVDKNEMKALPSRDDMIRYHFQLGMWLRNQWGLWGGSRLQKYFTDRGINHPDNMSSIILEHFYDWLKGNKETWLEWEKETSRGVSKK